MRSCTKRSRSRRESIDLTIVHKDKHVLIINKPAGLVVHPGAGNTAGTLQNALLHFDPGLVHLPRGGIVHRLDKDTSGLLVIARTLEAHTALVRDLEVHDVEREYEAICVGVMTAGGTVDAPLGPASRRSPPPGCSRRRSRIRHALPGDPSLSRSHACAPQSRNRPHPPDSRSHGPRPLSAGRGQGLWRKACCCRGARRQSWSRRCAVSAGRRCTLLAWRSNILSLANPSRPQAPTPADMQALLKVLKQDQQQAAENTPASSRRKKPKG